MADSIQHDWTLKYLQFFNLRSGILVRDIKVTFAKTADEPHRAAETTS
jgi:hypothetical protein